MNVFKKIYCRVFQTLFHWAIPLLPYRKPLIVDTLLQIPDLLKGRHIGKVLLVTDAGIRQLGLTRPLEEALENNGIVCSVFDGTHPNPTTEDVESACLLYKEKGCEAFIAFGGGSSIDCAKAVGARIAKPKKPLSKMKGILKVGRKIPLLIAVPTTAGTGSETTLAAVITDAQTRHKYPINDFPLIPKIAVLDPLVTASLPKGLTATTGMDALTHAIEAYIGCSTTRETRNDAEEAVKLIFENLPIVCLDGLNLDARRKMLRAAFLAGNAFSKSYVGYVHAVAHSLGGKYNMPHGLANAVLLPYVLKAYGKSAHKRLARLAVKTGLAAQTASRESAAQTMINAISRLSDEIGIPHTLSGIVAADIPEMARNADREANPLYPVPRLWNGVQLQKFYYDIMEENL